jgi:hypothetical protein
MTSKYLLALVTVPLALLAAQQAKSEPSYSDLSDAANQAGTILESIGNRDGSRAMTGAALALGAASKSARSPDAPVLSVAQYLVREGIKTPVKAMLIGTIGATEPGLVFVTHKLVDKGVDLALDPVLTYTTDPIVGTIDDIYVSGPKRFKAFQANYAADMRKVDEGLARANFDRAVQAEMMPRDESKPRTPPVMASTESFSQIDQGATARQRQQEKAQDTLMPAEARRWTMFEEGKSDPKTCEIELPDENWAQPLVKSLNYQGPDDDFKCAAATLVTFNAEQAVYTNKCATEAPFPVMSLTSRTVVNRISPDEYSLVEESRSSDSAEVMMWRAQIVACDVSNESNQKSLGGLIK